MEDKVHHHHPTGAIILIVIGALFLLSNLGILPLSVWFVLVRFWPILLVLLGIKILLGRGKNHEAFALISFILVALVLLIAIATVNPSLKMWMTVHMPWFPMNQMMQNPNSQNPFQMRRRYQMFNDPNFDNGGSNYFYNQTPGNSF